MNQFKQICFGLGNEMYETPCSVCGKPVKTWTKRRDVVFKCQECREQEKEATTVLTRKINTLTLERRLESAKQTIYKQYKNTGEAVYLQYEKAFEAIKKNLHRPRWFQSVNEVLAAAELIRSGTKARHQVKMGKWYVDFLLPELHAVLEIDGGYHNDVKRKEKDQIKDAAIIAHLGPQWEVVRIKDSLLKENIKQLVPAITAILDQRRKVRKSHRGQLPKNYSNTAI